MIYFASVEKPDGVCVRLSGEIDLSVSGRLYEVLQAVLRSTYGSVELDLHGLRLLDCTGITAILRARNDAHEDGRVLFVSNPRGIVRRVLAFAGLLTLLSADAPVSSPQAPAA
jgi:anti-sigma B factor antagonist